jgi:glutaminyl-tRNA synthetase
MTESGGRPTGPASDPATEERGEKASNFVHAIIEDHNRDGRFGGQVLTRFPPEPNGYLHIGHAKAIAVNFTAAQKYGGQTNLRFDDTNPVKEEAQFVDAIREDIRWLGFDWGNREFFASDYYETLYEYAVRLIEKGKAFVCDLSAEEVREHRGTPFAPGTDSPFRNRSPEENLDLFRRMRAGELPDGACTLRAKIDMASGNLNLRDPVMYRILHAHHHRTGDAWCIYPTYDWAHGQSDSIEGITHSICSLEFEDHRPLYDWFCRELGIHHPQQIEFARLRLTHTMMSKRRLRTLVEEGTVDGWDDPRLPTLRGLRRRGFTPEAIRRFAELIGVAKQNSTVDVRFLEHCVREHLNQVAPRYMAVLRPLKVVIENYPEGQVEELDAVNNPEDAGAGTRKVPFSRELYIEATDFMLDPPKKYFRLGPGREVRLRWGYYLTCVDQVTDDAGNVVEVRCTYDPETRGGHAPDGRKVRGTIHWVSLPHAKLATVRLYDHLFTAEDPDEVAEGESWRDHLNPNSVEVLEGCRVEPHLAACPPGERVQFERHGYFAADPRDSRGDQLVWNRTVSLKDTWARIVERG